MLIKAILVGLVLGLCKSEWIYGFPQVGRNVIKLRKTEIKDKF